MIKLTSFEKTKIIGLRADQISNGSPIYIDIENVKKDALSIAEAELKQGKIPLVIHRTFPNGKVVSIKVKDTCSN